MIVDVPTAFDLTIGSPARTSTAEDAQTVVPPVVTPVALTMRPHTGGFQSAVELNVSAMVETSQSRTNQVGITIQFAILGRGLWELQVSLATVFNYLGAVGSFNGVALIIGYQNQLRNVLKRLATAGGFVDNTTIRLLAQDPATLRIDLPLTGVGQSVDAVLMVNAVKIL